MRALAIETSTRRAGVVLLEDGAPVAALTSADPQRHAERLLELVDGVFRTAGWKPQEVHLIAAGIGPGSFTGVRVGLATAKGIALALACPIVGVGSLEAMAVAAWEGEAGRDPALEVVIPLLDARKGEVFWGAYGRDGGELAAPRHVAASALAAAMAPWAPRGVIVGEMAGALGPLGAPVHRGERTDLPDAAALGRAALARFRARGPDDLDQLEPAYVRPPDISVGC